MRDALHKFGNLSLAVKDTRVFSADLCDLGGFHSKARMTKHTWGEGLFICFRNTTVFLAADSYIPEFQDDSDSGFATNLKTISYPETAAQIAAGTTLRFPLPACQRYGRAAATPKSSGTFTAETVEAWLEHGPNELTI